MTRSCETNTRLARFDLRHAGFSLIELMIAITLGILISIGLVSLFGTTSQTNKVQNALALLQENGRFAAMRIGADLRMANAPYCSNSAGPAVATTNGSIDAPIAAAVYLTPTGVLNLPDTATANQSGPPTGWPATGWYPLSPSLNIQGYECDKGSTNCSPNLTFLPAQGTAAGNRVAGSDVLTVRYLQNDGWMATAASTAVVTATQQSGDTDFDFQIGDRILLGMCNNPVVTDATYVINTASTPHTLTATLTGATGYSVSLPMHVFNYTRDFVTVTYYLRYDADQNPDAAGRVIPVLVRRVNGGAGGASGSEDVVVQGVDKLDFLYGVADSQGNVRYLTADDVNSSAGGGITCSSAPVQFQPGYSEQSNCLWRAVKSIEIHMLVDTVNNVYAVDDKDTPYCYSIDPASSLATVDCSSTANYQVPAAASFNGMPGRMMRREFIALAAVRNAPQ